MAVDRRPAIFRLGVGVTIGALLLIVVARRVAATVPRATTTANAHAVSSALADSLRSSLVRVLLIAAIIAMAIALVALLGNRLVGWAGGHADMARLIAAALGVVVLLVLGMGWGSIILAVVVAGVGLLGVRYSLRAGTSPATGT